MNSLDWVSKMCLFGVLSDSALLWYSTFHIYFSVIYYLDCLLHKITEIICHVCNNLILDNTDIIQWENNKLSGR